MPDFIIGAEKKIVFIDVHKPTAVSQAVVNTVGIFSTKQEIAEQLVTSVKDIQGLTDDNIIYKKAVALFSAGAHEVLIYGKVTDDYKELFDGPKNDWFGTLTDEDDIKNLQKMSKELSAREKMFAINLEEFKETEIKGFGEDGTAFMFSKNDVVADANAFGYGVPKFPGSVLWANKLINGAVDSGYNGAEQGILDKNNCNYFAQMKGQLGFANGVTVTGDSLDFIHCKFALKFRLEEDITLWLKSKPKPAFVDTPELKAEILKRVNQFIDMNALYEDEDHMSTVTFPEISEIPSNDILKGVLTGVKTTVYYKYGIKLIKMDLYFAI